MIASDELGGQNVYIADGNTAILHDKTTVGTENGSMEAHNIVLVDVSPEEGEADYVNLQSDEEREKRTTDRYNRGKYVRLGFFSSTEVSKFLNVLNQFGQELKQKEAGGITGPDGKDPDKGGRIRGIGGGPPNP